MALKFWLTKQFLSYWSKRAKKCFDQSSRTAWPTKISIPLLSFLDNLLQDDRILYCKNSVKYIETQNMIHFGFEVHLPLKGQTRVIPLECIGNWKTTLDIYTVVISINFNMLIQIKYLIYKSIIASILVAIFKVVLQ